MQPIEMSDPAKIEQFLSKICLGGKGFTTECLLVDAFEAGLAPPGSRRGFLGGSRGDARRVAD